MSSSRGHRKRALREAATGVYRDAILGAAERVFGRAGFAEAKMAEIGREAGMAAGTLYNYFDSKEEIFRSLCEARAGEMLRRLDAAGGLIESVRASLAWIDEHREMFALVLEHGHVVSGMHQAHREEFIQAWERVVKQAVADRVLRSDVPAADLAALLIGSMKGFVQARLLRGSKKKLAEAAPLIVDVFVNGARGRR
jgi:AcrR family transcriptional regulator